MKSNKELLDRLNISAADIFEDKIKQVVEDERIIAAKGGNSYNLHRTAREKAADAKRQKK